MKKPRNKKANPRKPVYYLEHGKVIYRYIIGISWIQIDTDPETDWPEMPEYMRVCFAIETPTELDLLDKHAFFPSEEAEKIVLRAIKKKTNEQRKTEAMAEFRPLGRDSLCPSGATLVSTMPAPSGDNG